MSNNRPAILFVCLGNICRSPLAEAALRHAVEQAGLAVDIDSAGTSDWHIGKAPDLRAIAVARRHGCDIAHYRARQINQADFSRFTHIFALDGANLSTLRGIAPTDAAAEVSLLLDVIAGREGDSVTDPYFGEDSGFEDTWTDVVAAADALVSWLQTQNES